MVKSLFLKGNPTSVRRICASRRTALLITILILVFLVFAPSVIVSANSLFAIEFDGELVYTDSPPIRDKSGKIFVPFHIFVEQYNGLAKWDSQTKTLLAEFDKKSVTLIIGSTTSYVNGKEIILDVAPKIINGRLMVPTSFVLNTFGSHVMFTLDLKKISIETVPIHTEDEGDWRVQLNNAVNNLETKMKISFSEKNPYVKNDFSAEIIGNYQKKGILSSDAEISYKPSFDKNGKGTLEIKFGYTDGHSVVSAIKNKKLLPKLTAEQRAVYDKALQIVDEYTEPNMTDFEKEIILYDYLVLNCSYDHEAASNSPYLGPPLPKYASAYEAYGALIRGNAVCEGYSQAFKVLMAAVGVECDIISNVPDTMGELGHAWNLVKLDDGYYHVDVTWETVISYEDKKVSHEFFNLTDEQIRSYSSHNFNNHSFTGELLYPEANATKYQYNDLNP